MLQPCWAVREGSMKVPCRFREALQQTTVGRGQGGQVVPRMSKDVSKGLQELKSPWLHAVIECF